MARIIPTFLILFSVTLSLFAQEQRIALDTEGKFMVIDSELDKKILLFGNKYPGFQRAIAFLQPDSIITIEIEYRENNTEFRSKETYSFNEFLEFQNKVTLAIYEKASEETRDHSGRIPYILSSSIHSLAAYGPSVIISGDFQDRGAIATYMLIGAGGFFIPYWVTKNIDVTSEAASFKVYGQTRGLIHGALTANIFGVEDGENLFLASSIFSMVEAPIGFKLANYNNWSLGHVQTMQMMGDFGFGYGAAISDFVDAWDSNSSAFANSLIVSGSIGGLIAGNYLNKDGRYSVGDAFNSRGMGFLGAFTGLTLASYFNAPETDGLSALMVAGNLTGLYFGHKMAAKYEFTAGDGLLINLGTVAGGLTGLGLSYLAFSDLGEPEPYLTGTTLGAFTGLLLMQRVFTNKKGRKLKDTNELSFNYQFNPLPLMNGTSFISEEKPAQNPFRPGNYQPVLSMNLKF